MNSVGITTHTPLRYRLMRRFWWESNFTLQIVGSHSKILGTLKRESEKRVKLWLEETMSFITLHVLLPPK